MTVADSLYTSWGRFPQIAQQGRRLEWRGDTLPEPLAGTNSLLPYGNGRSYGDVCLNRGGTVIDTRSLNRFISFDAETGVLRCESGVLLSQILELCVPNGWFLPVSPGTRYVTIGGALANDVHGKNHHKAGTLGCYVRALELLRSDGSRQVCTPEENTELFAATIGGLGLTGLVTWVEIALRQIDGPLLQEESIKFANLQEFFRLSELSDTDYEFTVAWIDCIAKGASLGRGLFSRANHTDGRSKADGADRGPRVSVPFQPPFSLINRLSLKAFNAFWYNRQRRKQQTRTVHYRPFFYPLDAIGDWNRIYGPRGMLQYQCVLPGEDGRDVLRKMLSDIASKGNGSFLVVLKIFGDRESPGMLSFPRPGVTLALDFANSPEVFRLLDRLDAMTREVGGAVYPAKDARMSAESFQSYFPRWEEFAGFIDPAFSSSFWRRVTGDEL
ncbi:MAG: FAD-binding oxidoreductase [Gammaproteobacteria bacterium]|nr:FAD-binding oxidoreductase [Gammaproteobacteria bacterium]MDP6617262.1 FAD-binding oxidoreductase [Gammaproteobacteria bacterium]MDP7042244.1 FAD-binding oxidoreductase [Gammaproteobacteria bacterium]